MNESVLPSFFMAGGALSVDAPSYIAREADERLFNNLLHNQFCYVLVSRQMGKSSLMVRTAERLENEGITTVILDLNRLGHNLTREQWYYGLIMQIGRRVQLQSELKTFWRQSDALSPLQIWLAALEHILALLGPKRLVILIDEIDQVQLLPFSTDEFFAGIRSCYSQRAEDLTWHRLTFCLFGVALPSDLISDHRLTPFNIGTRIELTDFALDQVLTLKVGLERGTGTEEALLERVYYWTNGHPYLTQSLCHAIQEDANILTPEQVDALCARLYLSTDAQKQNDNLVFVRDRVLKSDGDVTALLQLYQRVIAGKRIAAEKANRLVNILLLSGIVRTYEGSLSVRNHIYASVFNRTWVVKHMPEADLRRQRRAYRRGVLRTAAVSGVLFTLLASFALYAFILTNRLHAAETVNRLNLYAADTLNRLNLYAADTYEAQRHWDEGNLAETNRLLAEHEIPKDRTDLRGWEWRYLWTQLHQDQRTLRGHTKMVAALAWSPNGKMLASGGFDNRCLLRDAHTGQQIASLPRQAGYVTALAFSRDNQTLAIGITGNAPVRSQIVFWDVAARAMTQRKILVKGFVCRIVYSADGRWLSAAQAVAGTWEQPPQDHNSVQVWDVRTLQEQGSFALPLTNSEQGLAISPDSLLVAATAASRGIVLYAIHQRKEIPGPSFPALTFQASSLAFSPDGRWLAAAGSSSKAVNSTVYLWDVRTRKLEATLPAGSQQAASVAFSPDRKLLAVGSWDYTVCLWKVPDGKENGSSWQSLSMIRGHTDRVNAIVFSPDSHTLATASSDKTVKLWELESVRSTRPVAQSQARFSNYSPAGSHTFATVNNKRLRLWNTNTLKFHDLPFLDATAYGAISADGNRIVTANKTGLVLRDGLTGQQLNAFMQPGFRTYHLAFSPDGNWLVATGEPGQSSQDLSVFDLRSGHMLLHSKLALEPGEQFYQNIHFPRTADASPLEWSRRPTAMYWYGIS